MSKQLKLQHLWRLDSEGNPLSRTVSLTAYNNFLPVIAPDGKTHKRGGWIQVSGSEIPTAPPPPLHDTPHKPSEVSGSDENKTANELPKSGTTKSTGAKVTSKTKKGAATPSKTESDS